MRSPSFLFGTFLLLVASFGSVEAQSPTLKIGYINSMAVYQDAPGREAAEQRYQEEVEKFQTELQGLEQGLRESIQQYEQQQATLSPEARQTREAALRERDGQLQQRTQALAQEASRLEQELVEPIMRGINEVIEEIRIEGGYSLILDVAPGSNVVAADPGLDLTAEVVRRLRVP